MFKDPNYYFGSKRGYYVAVVEAAAAELRERTATDRDADNELRDCADDDLRERGRDSEPDRDQRGDERETDPKRREKPHVLHAGAFVPVRAMRRRGDWQALPEP